MGRSNRAATAAVGAVTALATLVASACGPGQPMPLANAPLARCEDVPRIAAPPGWYRPTPVYVANEMPVEEVRAWAMFRPGYEDLWIDRDHLGWITVGFSADVPERQAELVEAFPDVGVVAVEVRHGQNDLDAVSARLFDGARDLGVKLTATLLDRGVVEVNLGVLDPARVAELAARFPGEPLCVTGIDPADAPDPGPQQAAGDGWRLLGHDHPAGPGYRTGIATEPTAYADLWERAELAGAPPGVDFATEVAIWFNAVTGSSCPNLRLDGIVVDEARALVHADVVNAEVVVACTADIHAHSFLVAVARDRLPAGGFAIQLGAEDPPGGMPEERTVVDADLRAPGSVAGPGAVHPDASLLAPGPGSVGPGDIVEPGFEPPFRFPVACGARWVGPLNGTWWRTSDPAVPPDGLPEAWATEVDAEGMLTADISMTEAGGAGRPASLVVTVGGRSIRYLAVAGEPACR